MTPDQQMTLLGMRIVCIDTLPPNTFALVPHVRRLPFETDEQFRHRVRELTVVFRGRPADDP